MLVPALNPVSVLSHPYMLPVHPAANDKPAAHIYYHQHTLQIIQLVEGQPPPPRRMGSIVPSDSSASSSSSTPYSDSDTDSCSTDDESVQSSYCSSDVPPDPLVADHRPYPFSIPDDTYSYRMKRVFAWRDHFSSDSDTSSSASSSLGTPAAPCHRQANLLTLCCLPPALDNPRSPALIRRFVSDTMDDDDVRRSFPFLGVNPSHNLVRLTPDITHIAAFSTASD